MPEKKTDAQSRQCPKCSGLMVEGYVADIGGLDGSESVWLKIKRDDLWNFSFGLPDNLERYHLHTYRCEKCGFLESYATERHY